MIHPRRGVKILGLYYYDPVLAEPRFQGPSARGGRHGGQWVIRSDRRDRRKVFFQDPDDHETWHVLRWTGLPPQGEVPAFSDKTVEALMADVRLGKLKVLSDTELLPPLLDILRSATPVDQVEAAAVAFESVPPDSSFPVYRGQRNNTGLWWSATTGGHVGFESWLERDHLRPLWPTRTCRPPPVERPAERGRPGHLLRRRPHRIHRLPHPRRGTEVTWHRRATRRAPVEVPPEGEGTG
jgi:hypothetical protein